MEVSITYGDGKVKLDIPESNLAGVIKPKQLKLKQDLMGELERVLDNPHGPTLTELAKSKSVCVLV
ncbi:MAG: lactate racemase domain-containing protein, partial [Candidatus Thorarchaeota archaeon]